MDAAAKALNRFEVYNRFRDFKAFHTEQAIGFKKHLAEQKGLLSGETLSKATLYATLTQLKNLASRERKHDGNLLHQDGCRRCPQRNG